MNLELFGDLPLPILAMVIGTYANALKKRNGVWIGRINRDTLDAFDMEFGRAMKTWMTRLNTPYGNLVRVVKFGRIYTMWKTVMYTGITYYKFTRRDKDIGDHSVIYPIELM